MLLLPCPPHLASVLVDRPAQDGARAGGDFESRLAEMVQELAVSPFDRQAAQALRAAVATPPPFREFVPPGPSEGSRVVVIDAVASRCTEADRTALLAMLDVAERENPTATLMVLSDASHPEDGVLAPSARRRGIPIVPAATDPAELALHVGRAYTVASALGWHLLLCGVPVRCFGSPFYAGWGLTEDEGSAPAGRIKGADLDMLVEAAMIRLVRYRNPYTGEAIEALAALDIARDMARMIRMNARIGSFYRFLSWKRATIARMFADPAGPKPFSRLLFRAIAAARSSGKALVAWASDMRPGDRTRIARSGIPVIRMEDGFIRSVGLGASGYQPLSLVLDDRGIYYDCHMPSRLEAILAEARFDARLAARARALIDLMLASRITKYNLTEEQATLPIPPGRKVIFVPGQVEDDASILLGADGMRAREQLEMIRNNNPDAFIIYKPHPDVSAGLRKGLANAGEALIHADLYLENHSVLALVEAADEVHTITSLTGFEALLRGKPVTCYGKPFYAGWGLTTDIAPIERRVRKLALEELVAGTLILYPHYLDPVSGLPASPEVAIRRIEDYRVSPARPDVMMHIRSRIRLWLRRLTR